MNPYEEHFGMELDKDRKIKGILEKLASGQAQAIFEMSIEIEKRAQARISLQNQIEILNNRNRDLTKQLKDDKDKSWFKNSVIEKMIPYLENWLNKTKHERGCKRQGYCTCTHMTSARVALNEARRELQTK